MRVTGWLRRNWLETGWAVFAAANLAVMLALPRWETIPFHFIWVSLTLLYGFRVLGPWLTAVVLGLVVLTTGVGIMHDAITGTQPWDEIAEVPLMSAMFLAMVWHAHRRRAALRLAQEESARRQQMLVQQERFLHDASHELRTPVTIARGHLELIERTAGPANGEIDVALDELGRIERILDRLLLLAKVGRPGFVAAEPIDAEAFLEDVFMRWSEVAPRAWRLGTLATGTLAADAEGVRVILDALLENAVKYTEPGDAVELRSRAGPGELAIEVADSGRGIAPEALSLIFERFGRADASRSRSQGGVGLGLAIVDAIAKAHGGSCTVETSAAGTTFAVRLPRFTPAAAADVSAAADVPTPVLEAG